MELKDRNGNLILPGNCVAWSSSRSGKLVHPCVRIGIVQRVTDTYVIARDEFLSRASRLTPENIAVVCQGRTWRSGVSMLEMACSQEDPAIFVEACFRALKILDPVTSERVIGAQHLDTAPE